MKAVLLLGFVGVLCVFRFFFFLLVFVCFTYTHECLQDVLETKNFPQCYTAYEHPALCSIRCWIGSFQTRLRSWDGDFHSCLFISYLKGEGSPPTNPGNSRCGALNQTFTFWNSSQDAASLELAALPQYRLAKCKRTSKIQIISFMFNSFSHSLL